MTEQGTTTIRTYEEYVDRFFSIDRHDSVPSFQDGLDFYEMGQQLASAVLTRHLALSPRAS